MSFVKNIEKFNKERKLLDKEFDIYTELSFIYEELSEGLRGNNIEDVIDALADIVVFSIGSLLKLNVSDPNRFIMQLESLTANIQHQENNEPIDAVDLVVMALKMSETNTQYLTISQYIEKVSEVFRNLEKSKFNTDYKYTFLNFSNRITYQISYINQTTNSEDQQYIFIYIFASIVLDSLLTMEFLGYNSEKVMNEVTKHILSRKGQYDEVQGKWIKDKTQDPSTLYQPNFSKCYKGA